MEEKITFACVTQNRIDNLKRNIPRLVDYVDHMVVVDGFSVDGTKEWLETTYGDKVTVTQRQWNDSFADQYNRYLEHIDNGWVLILDDDEIPSKALLEQLKPLVDRSNEGRNFDIVDFRCHPMGIDKDWNIIDDNGPAEYWRQIFYRYNPGMRYVVDLHQAVVGHKYGRPIRRTEVYYHLKSELDNYRNALRNWFIAGVWMPGASEGFKPPEWHEFKKVVTDAYSDVKVFGDLNAKMIQGNIKQEVKDYLEKIKDIEDEQPNRLFNELRAAWKYYYEFLHPEEKIQ